MRNSALAWDTVVVGAGICGLATAYELARRGASVLVIEAAGVGAEQSAGLARIFRVAHRDARLRELALEARAGWQRWERELDAHLLGDEGLVLVGGMDGFVGSPMDAEEIRARLPMLAPGVWEDAVFDELAGAIRVRRALDALAARVEVRLGTVTGVDADGTVWVGDERVTASAVVVCAGLGTQALVADLGLDLQLRTEPHVRVTYEPAGPAACFISPEAYGVPLGRTGRYAIGMHEPGTGCLGGGGVPAACGRWARSSACRCSRRGSTGTATASSSCRAGPRDRVGGEQRDEVRAGDRRAARAIGPERRTLGQFAASRRGRCRLTGCATDRLPDHPARRPRLPRRGAGGRRDHRPARAGPGPGRARRGAQRRRREARRHALDPGHRGRHPARRRRARRARGAQRRPRRALRRAGPPGAARVQRHVFELPVGPAADQRDDAWARTRGAGVAVAVVDSGVDTTHPDLAGVFTGNAGERGSGRETNGVDDDGNGLVDDWQGWDFVNHDNTVETQSQSHGTHVAGTIAALADNNRGVAGVAPEARILPLKVFGARGLAGVAVRARGGVRLRRPPGSARGQRVARRAGLLHDRHERHPGVPEHALRGRRRQRQRRRGRLLPVQRERGQRPVRRAPPDEDDARAGFSNYSATAVDLFAPGVDIVSTVPGSYGVHGAARRWRHRTWRASPRCSRPPSRAPPARRSRPR